MAHGIRFAAPQLPPNTISAIGRTRLSIARARPRPALRDPLLSVTASWAPGRVGELEALVKIRAEVLTSRRKHRLWSALKTGLGPVLSATSQHRQVTTHAGPQPRQRRFPVGLLAHGALLNAVPRRVLSKESVTHPGSVQYKHKTHRHFVAFGYTDSGGCL